MLLLNDYYRAAYPILCMPEWERGEHPFISTAHWRMPVKTTHPDLRGQVTLWIQPPNHSGNPIYMELWNVRTGNGTVVEIGSADMNSVMLRLMIQQNLAKLEEQAIASHDEFMARQQALESFTNQWRGKADGGS